MTKTNELKKKLRYGDYGTIAELTGYSTDYVRKVINDKRHNTDVIEATKKVIQSRETLKKELGS